MSDDNPYLWLWRERRRQLIGLGIVLLLALSGLLLLGLSLPDSPGALQEGDCLEAPLQFAVVDVPTQPCDELHTAQVLRIVEASADTRYPFFGGLGKLEVCEEAVSSTLDVDALPADAELSMIHTNQQTWESGDRTVMCIVTSTAGMTGSVYLPD